ncbi:MAG: tetratricopeptide repeat-containing sensor histidine kinase [Bacteroidia bacterium]
MNQILNKYRSATCFKHIRLILFFSFFLFDFFSVEAGSLDSLLKDALQEKEPKKYNEKYLNYINKLSSEKRDSAAKLLVAYEDECQKGNFEFGRARSMSLRAWFKNYDGKYEEGLKILRETESIQKRIHDPEGLALTLNRIGIVNLRYKRFDDAIKYVSLSLAFYEKLNDSNKIDIGYNNLGSIYVELKKFDKAVDYFKRTIEMRKKSRNYYWLGYAYYNTAEAYFGMEQMDSASYYYQTSLQVFKELTEAGLVPPMVDLGIGRFYYKNKDLKQALFYVSKGLQRAKEIDHKELILEGTDLLSDVYAENKDYKAALDARNEYLSVKNFIDSTNSFSQIAEIEERYKSAENEVEIERLKSAKLEADGKAQQFLFYAIGLLFILILSASLIWIFWQKRNQTDKIKRAELNAKIAEAKMFALKAQMNPHFVFNCINTAQNFVLNNKKERAYEYLSDFAKLMRLVMENSSKLYIPVEDELQQIRLYIELESIRFEKRFGYRIFVDPELENGVYEIPGMILQPLIENAIGHGLINRQEEGGELVLQLSLSGEKVLCELSDNGVGRKKAAEIKAKKSLHYSSAAIPNIKERLIMLDGQYKLEIIDLVEKGIGVGTKVILELPYR